MKNIYVLIVSLFLAPTAFSQHKAAPNVQQARHMQIINALLQQNDAAQPVAKSTTGVTKHRVIAQSTRDNTVNTLVDSFDLKYAGLHTSKYDYNTMLYAYNYPYSTSPMFNFNGVFTKPQILFDTCLRWTVNPFTNVYGAYNRDVATYDAANNLKTFDDTVDHMSYVNIFNTSHNITIGYWFNTHDGVQDSAFKQYFEYNTAGKLVKDSIYERHLGVWRIASRTAYTYDGSGNLTQIDQYTNATDTSFLLPLVEYQKYVNTYDASNRLLTVLTSLYNGTTLAASMKDTFAYTGTVPFCTSWKQHQFDPINNYWAPMISVQKHLNTSSLPDTINTYGFDSLLNSWVPQQRDIMHYNSNHDPDTMRSYLYSWTAFPTTPDYTTVYYYGTYIDASSVQQTNAIGKAIVYPNPVHDELIISLPGVVTNTNVAISIVSTSGQIISRQSMVWQGNAHIATTHLVPGLYNVIIQSANGSVMDSRLIVKQ